VKNLLLFESYVSQIYEIRFAEPHYSDRTSLESKESRVVPYALEFPYGFIIENLVDANEALHDPDYIEEYIDLDLDKMYDYTSKALHFLTNSKKLIDWKPSNEKTHQLIDLGRICFSYYGERFYPIIAGGKGPDETGFYDGGDKIWLLLKENDKAITIKYYEGSERGERLMFGRSAADEELTPKQFQEISAFGYPYGKKFEVIIDVTEDDPEDVVIAKIRKQVGDL